MVYQIFESEKELLFFREMLDSFLNKIKKAVIIIVNEEIFFVNQDFCNITGYTKDEVYRMKPLDFVHHDFLNLAKKNMATNSVVPYETWAKRKDGSQLPVLITPNILQYKGNSFRIVSIKNLTQEKQYLKQERLLRKTMEQTHESIVITDIDANIIYVNNKFCEITGYSKEEVMGANPNILQSGYHTKTFYESMWQIITSGKVWHGVLRNKKKDNSLYWEEATIVPIVNEAGKIDSYLGVKKDITEQKMIEENFKNTEIKYYELIKNAPIGIISADISGNIIIINPVIETFSKILSLQEIKKINILTSPLLRTIGVSDQFQKCINNKKKIKYEVSYRLKNGKDIYFRLYLSPVTNQEGKVISVLLIIENISQEKEYEKVIIKAKEKAEENDRLKDIFLANMSHELRTPLNAILGFTEILNNSKNLLPEQKEYLTYIENSANHLLELVTDLVDIAQIESGKITINKEKIKVSDLINTLIPITEKQFSIYQKDYLDFTIDINDAIKNYVLNVDKSRFVQIIINLINNAIKYTNEGGIVFSATVVKDELVFSVQDTGIGIPEDKHETIFERFRQTEENLTRQYEGSGLGLTIAKELVTLMEGRIWLKSELGKGSVFSVAFRIDTHTEEEIQKDIITVNNRKILKNRFTILLVEDNSQNKLLIKTVLLNYNFNVIEADNGKKAIEILKKTPFINLVLMDIQMPEMNGIEATKIIRKMNITIPIIAQTALAFPEDKKKALDAGCNEVLIKPFKQDQLLTTIIKYLTL